MDHNDKYATILQLHLILRVFNEDFPYLAIMWFDASSRQDNVSMLKVTIFSSFLKLLLNFIDSVHYLRIVHAP